MIRLARSADAEAVAAIYNHYIRNSVASFEESTLSRDEMALRIDEVHACRLPWLVAEDTTGILLGYAYATPWRKRSAYRHTVEISTYLTSTEGSKGWGTQLYQSLFKELRKLDIHTVIAGIALPNAVSVALHEKFGMKKVAHFAEVGFKFGEWIDVGYWQINLNGPDFIEDSIICGDEAMTSSNKHNSEVQQ